MKLPEMKAELEQLNLQGKAEFLKDPKDEDFVRHVNLSLQALEESSYVEQEVQHPFIFVFGLPRSGTTLITQLLSNCMDLGFINNFMARFWLAPVTGIKLAKSLHIDSRPNVFESTFGATRNLEDIHEFGYFWRHWLKKKSFKDVERASELEKEIDWNGLRAVLANMQAQFQRPMIMKNILGSYHLRKLRKELGKVIYVYIERDELDVAVSILGARRRHYTDLNKWWSYVPPDYRKIADLDYWHQIAGQVHHLKAFYYKEMEDSAVSENLITVNYSDLVSDPGSFLENVSEFSQELYGSGIEIVNSPPTLTQRQHEADTTEREKFEVLLREMRAADE
jgi:hypothetical protein